MKRCLSMVLIAIVIGVPSAVFGIEITTIKDLGPEKHLEAELVLPDGNGPFPGLVLLHSSGGESLVDTAKMLAGKGYASIVPSYFDARGIRYHSRGSALTVHAEGILADLKDCVRYLKSNPRIAGARLGAIGFSMGGYWAVLLAGMGDVQAGVTWYGVLSGVGKRNRGEMKYKFEEIITAGSSPVLILHGSGDPIQPVEGAHRLSALLEAAKVPYEKYIFESIGHGYNQTRGGHYDYRATQESWEKTAAFLNKHLMK